MIPTSAQAARRFLRCSALAVALAAPTAAGAQGAAAWYFEGRDLAGEAMARIDAQIAFDWQDGGPAELGPDNFSARWEGWFTPVYTEPYRILTWSDDGVRLWLNGALVIDNWTDHGRALDEAPIALTAGEPVAFALEWYERGGNAVIELGWASPSQVEELIPPGALTPGPVVPPDAVPVVTLTSPDPRATEGRGDDARLTVARWGPLGEALRVPLRVSGEATPGVDVEPLPAVVEIPAHLRAVSVPVVPLEDMVHRGRRTLRVEALAGDGYTLGAAREARVTVLDDDPPPPPDVATVAGEVHDAPPGAVVIQARAGDAVEQQVVLGDGPFALGGLPPGRWTVTAFHDADGDGARGPDELGATVDGAAQVEATLPPDRLGLTVQFPVEPTPDAEAPDAGPADLGAPDQAPPADAAPAPEPDLAGADAGPLDGAVSDALPAEADPAGTAQGCRQRPGAPSTLFLLAPLAVGLRRRRGEIR